MKPSITYDAHNKSYLLNGPITFDTATQLAGQVPEGATLYVTSPGGRGEVARRIADWANAKRINVVVTGTCASACITIAASKQTHFEGDVALLFHGRGEEDNFYISNGKNPQFMHFADEVTQYVYQQRSRTDNRKKLIGVAVPYFWVPTSAELECFGLNASVKALKDFKPAAQASGTYFTTQELPQHFQERLIDICKRWLNPPDSKIG